jgi:hypothetical protein
LLFIGTEVNEMKRMRLEPVEWVILIVLLLLAISLTINVTSPRFQRELGEVVTGISDAVDNLGDPDTVVVIQVLPPSSPDSLAPGGI